MAKVVDAPDGYSPLENPEGGKKELSPEELAKKELKFSKNVAITKMHKHLDNLITPEDMKIEDFKKAENIEDIITKVSDQTEKALGSINKRLKKNAPRKLTQNIYSLGGKSAVDRIMKCEGDGLASAEIGETNLKYLKDSEATILKQFKREQKTNEDSLKQKAAIGTWVERTNREIDKAPRWMQSNKTGTIAGAALGTAFAGPLGTLIGGGVGYGVARLRKGLENFQVKRREAKAEKYMTLSGELETALKNKMDTYKDNAKEMKDEGEAGRKATEDMIISEMDLVEEKPKKQAKMIDALMRIQAGKEEDADIKLFFPGARDQEKIYMYEAVKNITWLSDRANVKRNLDQAKAQTESVRKVAKEQEKAFLGKFERAAGNVFEEKKKFADIETMEVDDNGTNRKPFEGIRLSDKEIKQDDLIGSIRSDITFAKEKGGLKDELSKSKIQGLLGISKSSHLLYTLDYIFKTPSLLLHLSQDTKQKLLTWMKQEDDKHRASEVASGEGTFLQREYWKDIEGDGGLLKEGQNIFSEMKVDMLDETSVASFDGKINTLPELERKHGSVLKKCMQQGIDISDIANITEDNLNDDIVKSLKETGGQDELIKKLKEIKGIFDKITKLRNDWDTWKNEKTAEGKTFLQNEKSITDQKAEVEKAESFYRSESAGLGGTRGEANPEKEKLRVEKNEAVRKLNELKTAREGLLSKLSEGGGDSIVKMTTDVAKFFSIDAPGIKFHKELKLEDGVETEVPIFERIQRNLFREFENETEDKLLKVWERNDPLKTITGLKKRAGNVKVSMIDNADAMYELHFPSDLGKSTSEKLRITSNTTDKVVELENKDMLVRIASPCVNKGEGSTLNLVKNAIVYKKGGSGKLSKARHAIVSNITLES